MNYHRVDQYPPTVVVRILEVNQSVVQLNGLNEFTNYSVQVSAFTSKGHGPNSAPLTVMTDEDGTVLHIDKYGQTDATF